MRRLMIMAVSAALALGLFAAPALAAGHDTFDLTVKHRVNGVPFGLDQELPVDVYVDGALAIPGFEFTDTVKTELPAGDYFIEVKLAGSDTVVMTLQTGEVPAGADVLIIAKRTGPGFGLQAVVR